MQKPYEFVALTVCAIKTDSELAIVENGVLNANNKCTSFH